MSIYNTPSTTISEGRAFDVPTVLRTFTSDNEWVQNLGTVKDPWVVEATLSGGDADAKLVGEYNKSEKEGSSSGPNAVKVNTFAFIISHSSLSFQQAKTLYLIQIRSKFTAFFVSTTDYYETDFMVQEESMITL